MFSRLANEPPAVIPEGYSAPLDIRTAAEIEHDRLARKSAPPKPAPDAMRIALQKLVNEVAGVWDAFEFGIRAEISNTNYTCVQERLNEAEAILRDRSSAPVPPVDETSITINREALYRAISNHLPSDMIDAIWQEVIEALELKS